MLLATSVGTKLRGDPGWLWWQLADRMPPSSADRCETQAGLLLAAVAAGASGDLDAIVAEPLSAIGWIRSDGTQLTGSAAADAGWDTRTLLWRLAGSSADGDGFEPGEPTSEGTLVTRTALCTWPAWGRP